MRLQPGAERLYKQWHDEIWPELGQLIRSSGVRNYSIFRDGLDLFAYAELDDRSTSLTRENPVMARWWDALAPYMEYEPEGIPRTWPMVEVFHQD